LDDVDGCDGVGGGVAGVLGASDSDVMAEVLGVEITTGDRASFVFDVDTEVLVKIWNSGQHE
jgi:hypothetical protein